MKKKNDLVVEKLAEVRESIKSTNENIAVLQLKHDALVGFEIVLERRARRRTRGPLFDRRKS